MKRLFCFIFIIVFSCSSNDSRTLVINDIPENQMAFQKMVIGQLTGEIPIVTLKDDTVSIPSRWTSKEKAATKAYLKALLVKLGLEPKMHHYSMPNQSVAIDLLIEPLKGTNIYATLPSTTGSDDYIIIGSHYDTGGKNVPGAIDNGSGMAVILSVIKKASELEFRNKNLMIVFFDQEEEGISAGSKAFAKHLNKTNLKVHSVHTYDLIGWDADNNKEIEIELPSKEIEALYNKHASLLNIPMYTTNTRSSDHYSFIKAGFNALGVSQAYGKGDNSGLKDTPGDTYELVNFEYLESATNLAFEVLKDIMND